MKKIFILLMACSITGIATAQTNFDLKTHQATPTTKNTAATTESLQSTLYQLIAHYHGVQQAHWNVQGPQFESLHGLLGDFYGALGTDIDRVAERQIILGSPADGRPRQVAQTTILGATPNGFQKDYDVVKDLSTKTQKLSNFLSDQIEITGETNVVTQDLLIDVKAGIDIYLWKIRSFSYN
ncbi:Dps family protein [Nonlabens agnitus]|uniref:Ferritin/DPS domain-containing protein n=1 Tax=Nonlabens agnitus TaxID=870484 RepID=A0A2S9WSI5_9FLAO|nr:DNA starvation/stationary phase protection protein [Nonlabens agnitus]PRP66451.1 hypothetical protein BST86_04760 [Nonlabens agnitus]